MDPVLAAQFDSVFAAFGACQAQLVALRMVAESSEPLPPEPKGPCPHLNTQDAGSTLTHTRMKCLDCGQIVEA